MTRALIALSFLLTMLPPIQAQVLASLVDKSRVLLIFAPTDFDPRYQQQLTFLRHHAPEMKDRDLVLLPILSQSDPPTTANNHRQHPPLPPSSRHLRRRATHHPPSLPRPTH